MMWQKAAALGNLGKIVATQAGDLTAAEGYYQKILKLDQELGHKEGVAGADYCQPWQSGTDPR